MNRPRFTLRTLLIAVTACALGIGLYRLIPERELFSGLRFGDTPDQVIRVLGRPQSVVRQSSGSETWYYKDGRAEFRRNRLAEVVVVTTTIYGPTK